MATYTASSTRADDVIEDLKDKLVTGGWTLENTAGTAGNIDREFILSGAQQVNSTTWYLKLEYDDGTYFRGVAFSLGTGHSGSSLTGDVTTSFGISWTSSNYTGSETVNYWLRTMDNSFIWGVKGSTGTVRESIGWIGYPDAGDIFGTDATNDAGVNAVSHVQSATSIGVGKRIKGFDNAASPTLTADLNITATSMQQRGGLVWHTNMGDKKFFMDIYLAKFVSNTGSSGSIFNLWARLTDLRFVGAETSIGSTGDTLTDDNTGIDYTLFTPSNADFFGLTDLLIKQDV